jgi:hypothetical protein
LCGNTAYGQNNLRFDQGDLPFQISLAGRRFLRGRIAIPGRTAFDHVSDVNGFPFETDGPNHFVEQLPGPPHEWFALQIFLFSRRFANHHPFGFAIADAENSLSTSLV